jgi:hypothetical protein
MSVPPETKPQYRQRKLLSIALKRAAALVDTYATERLKMLNLWSMFTDDDLGIRPQPFLSRDRNAYQHMIHQCMREDIWLRRTRFRSARGDHPVCGSP